MRRSETLRRQPRARRRLMYRRAPHIIGRRGYHGNGTSPTRGCPAPRDTVFDALLRMCRWTQVYYLWRPNLPDESDNHVIELAVAGGAEAVVTKNVKDFSKGELLFARLAVLTPGQLIEE